MPVKSQRFPRTGVVQIEIGEVLYLRHPDIEGHRDPVVPRDAPVLKVTQVSFDGSFDQGCRRAKFDPFLSLDCAELEGWAISPSGNLDLRSHRKILGLL